MANHNYKNYYSRGSEALEVLEPPIRRPHIGIEYPRNKPKRKISRKFIEKHRAINKLNLKSKIIFMVLGVYSFVLAIWCISINVENSSMSISLNNLKAEINENYNKIEDLQVSLAQSYDLKNIEYIAKNKLHMDKPSPEQVIGIDIVNENYTEYYEDNNKTTFLDRLKGVFNG